MVKSTKKQEKKPVVKVEVEEEILSEREEEEEVASEIASEDEEYPNITSQDVEDLDEPSHDDDDTEASGSNSDEIGKFQKKLTKINSLLTNINKISLKDSSLTKEFVSNSVKTLIEIEKLNGNLLKTMLMTMSKELLPVLKKKDKKLQKKLLGKGGAVKKLAIDNPLETYPQVLTFLELEEGTLVSRNQVQQAIHKNVRAEKEKNNPEIFVEGDKRKFNLIGKNKELFKFIRQRMTELGHSKEELPGKSISIADVMKYTPYCFTKKT